MIPSSVPAEPALPRLPSARQLAVTWGIPERFGGMTASMLHRSRAFAEHAGATVDILTLEPDLDVETTRRRLGETGRLVDGMRLRNVYDDFRRSEGTPTTVPQRPAVESPPGAHVTTVSSGSVLRWTDGDDVVRTEHRRVDGTLALLDEQRRSGGPRRLLTAFDASGRTTGQWRSASGLYFHWIDSIVGDDPAVMIVDSKAVAPLIQRYHRGNVTKIYRVHGSHFEGDGSAGIAPSRRAVFERLHQWDGVVFLTERQRRDVIELVGDTGNLHVVANAVVAPEWMPRLPADPLHGVIVSRLSTLKRLDHALRVIAAVREMGVDVTADIVGSGAQRTRLQETARRLGLEDSVRFVGYKPDAARRFADGAWTLLTSSSEGGSLTLVEAMSAGCIPISYDIRYGPAEVIAHGRSGWLVPDGDSEAAARLLAHQCMLDEDEMASMRRAARRTALALTDPAITGRWADVQRSAIDHRRRSEGARECLDLVRVLLRRKRTRVSARLRGSLRTAAMEVRLRSADGTAVVVAMTSWGARRRVTLSRTDSELLGDGPLTVIFTVRSDDGPVAVDAGPRHPDRRSLHRRVAGRARRLLASAASRRQRPTSG